MEVLHYPRLDTVLNVEKVLKNVKEIRPICIIHKV